MERTYTISLRKEIQKAPYHKRTKKAIRALKEFVARHAKHEVVKIGPELNDHLWSQGMQHPPAKVQVALKKTEEYVYVNLVGKSLEPKKIEQKKKEDKNMLEQQMDKLKGLGKKDASKVEETQGKEEAQESEKETDQKEQPSESADKKSA
ncbi:MAG: 50S ribosomal protein L31e [Candidatus Woesearchaeota archaeon]